MRKKTLLIFAACLLITFVRAQNRVWTFQQCLDTAIQRNISLNQSRLNTDLSRITLEQSKANRFPNLNASARDGISFGRSVNPTTNQYVERTTNSSSFGVNTGVDLFNGFQITRTILQNKMNLDAVKTDVENVRNQVTLNITTAYLQLLFQYEILKSAKNQTEATTIQVDRTQKMVNAGKVPESNLFTIRSQQATDNLAVVNAQGQLDLAKVTLEQLMEIPVTDSFEVKIPDLVEPSLLLNQTNQEIYNKALTVQPQIAGASIRTNSALLGIKISEGARYPSLSLSGSVNSNYSVTSRTGSNSSVKDSPFFPQLWTNLGESIGLNLYIPIYSNRQLKSNIERAKINALSVQLDEQNTRLQLRKTIEQSYTDLRNSIKKYEAVKEQISAAELSYQNMERKYNVGMSTAIDYLIEKNNYFQAQSNGIQAKYDYIFKSKILDFYQGKPIQF
ncbi:MAG TPA: TolC family protein [Bacteroidales bacterium]|nr:TolC family protein [Bacteroidales bacterium]